MAIEDLAQMRDRETSKKRRLDNLKQSMIQDYRIAFSMIGDNHDEEANSTIAVWILKRLPIYGISLSLFQSLKHNVEILHFVCQKRKA